MSQATLHYISEIPTPEQVLSFRGLKMCWIIEMPNVIVYSADREKCTCKAKKVSAILKQLKNCD